MDGYLAARHCQVGADAVGQHALVQDFVGDIKGEVHASVGSIQPYSTFVGFFSLGNQLAVIVQHSAGVAGEVVGDNVSLVQDGQQFTDHIGVVALEGVSNVHHQGHASLNRRPFGHLRHLHAHDLQSRGHHPRFNAGNHAFGVGDGLNRLVQIDALRTEDVWVSGQTGPADVQKNYNLSGGVGDNVFRETLEGVTARTSRIDHSGYAGADAANVRVNSVVGNTGVDVGVNVDYARGYNLAFDFNNPFGLFSGDVYGNLGDFAVLDGNVADGV